MATFRVVTNQDAILVEILKRLEEIRDTLGNIAKKLGTSPATTAATAKKVSSK